MPDMPITNDRRRKMRKRNTLTPNEKYVSQDDDRFVDAGISIVCVYNDPEVRKQCLDRSIDAYGGSLEIDYIAMDNTGSNYSTAGAALNHGAEMARFDVVVFVHQDVHLHSIDRLAAVGAALIDGNWGLLGANGVTSQGESVARLRDRTQLIGRHAPTPVDVESVDEVLFMVSRDVVLEYRLTEDPDLAWHAYAVEYGLRMRSLGKRVGAVDMAVTHNSLTINLDRLDVAHRRVGDMYPQLRPIRTTCGTIGVRESNWRNFPLVRNHRWRLRWLRHSMLALRVRRRMDAPIVLSDIRHEVDLLPFSDESPLYLFNIDRVGGFAEFAAEPMRLTRYGRPVVMCAVRTLPELLVLLDMLPDISRILVMGVDLDDLNEFGPRTGRGRDWLVGIHGASLWLLRGSDPQQLPGQWSRPQAVPLGSRR